MYRKTEGLVLRDVNYKDSGKILTVLTPQGKRTVSARGARRKNSKLAGACQLFAFSEMELFEYRGRFSMDEAEPKELFLGLRGDILSLSLAAYFMELLEAVCNEEEDSGQALSLALNSLFALEQALRPHGQIKAVFEMRLMALAGFAPMLEGCAACGRVLPQEPRLNILQGVLHCAACKGSVGDGISMPLCEGSLQALRHIMNSDSKRVFSFSLGEESLQRLADLSEAFVHTQLERSFRTLDFYKGLLI